MSSIKRNHEENSRLNEDGEGKLNNPIRKTQWKNLPSRVDQVEGRLSELEDKIEDLACSVKENGDLKKWMKRIFRNLGTS